MKKILFVCVVTLLTFSAIAQNATPLLSNYIKVKNALVNGEGKVAAEAATALQKSIQESTAFAQKENLQNAVNKLVAAKNIEKQRIAFTDVSTLMWAFVKGNTAVKEEVFYQYCPMKKAYWLSTEKEIRNPYYGASMLECGKVVEIKK
ncbi:MAG: DUF3347 domain-containing protein [Chitinophagales bacterium]|nr:DUF3347 domain-containing protein [Chitinophagales bacterium]